MLSDKTVEVDTKCKWKASDGYGPRSYFFRWNPKTGGICTGATPSDPARHPILYGCRESFEYRWNHQRNAGLQWKEDGIKLKPLVEFWHCIEERIGVKNESEFFRVTTAGKANPELVAIKLSPFWPQNYFTKAICTLMLRYGLEYGGGDPTNANDLRKYNLAYRARDAIKLFFAGHTEWIPFKHQERGGWISAPQAGVFVSHVQCTREEELPKKFIKPKKPKHLKT